MAQKVGGVLIDIQTNVAKIQKDFGSIDSTIKKFAYKAKREFKSIGINLGFAFSVYQIKRFIVEGAKTINMMQDMAQSAGITAKNFQGLAHAASYSNVEAEGVARAMKRLNTNILDANYGLMESKRLFDDLGIKYRTSNGEMRDTWEVYKDLSDKLAEMGDNSRKAGLANKFLGRAGAGMIPTMNLTSKGIEKVTKNLEKWGALVTDETMAIMHEVNKNFKDMGAGLRGIKLQVLAGMAEELQQISTAWINNQEALANFVKVGDIAGKVLIKIAVGAAGVAATAQVIATLGAALVAFNPEHFADPEVLTLIAKKVEDILYNWGNLMRDLQKPIKYNLGIGSKGQGLEGIDKILEDQRVILGKIVKEYTSKVELFRKEEKFLQAIQARLGNLWKAGGKYLEIWNAINLRLTDIRYEMKRLETADVWGNMKYGAEDYFKSIKDKSKQIQEATVNAYKSMEDALVDFVVKGKIEWAGLRDAIISDIARIIIRQRVMSVFNWFGVTPGGDAGSGSGMTPNSPSTTTPSVTPTKLGRRRGLIDNSVIGVSNNTRNIVEENTYLMTRQVDDFVKHSETEYRRMGRTLRRSLGADEFGRGGVLGSPTGYSYPGAGGTTGGAAISGVAASSGGISGFGNNAGESITNLIDNPNLENFAKALIETNIIKMATDAVVDALDKPLDWAGDRTENLFNPSKWSFRKRGGDSGGDTIINVPVSIAGGNSAMASEMRTEIEKTVIEVMRRYT